MFELLCVFSFLIAFFYFIKPANNTLKKQIQAEITSDADNILSNLIDTMTAKAATGFGATYDIKDFIVFKFADVKLASGEKNMYIGIAQCWIPLDELSFLTKWVERKMDTSKYQKKISRKPLNTPLQIRCQ